MYENKHILIKHHKIGLRAIGASLEASRYTKLYTLFFYFGIGIQLFFLIFEIWNVTLFYRDLEILMDNLVSTIGVISGLFKTMVFRLKRRTLKLITKKIYADWNNENEVPTTLMKENRDRAHLFSKSVIFVYNSMNFTYFIRTLASWLFDPVEERKFLAQVTLPIDGRQSPIYEVTILGQFITASICFNTQSFVEGHLSTVIFHACSKVESVKKEIKNFSLLCDSNTSDKRLILKSLRNLSRKHMSFIEFMDNVQDIWSHIAFFHLFFMTLLQVFSSYMVMDGLEKGTKWINLIHYAILSASFFISSSYYCALGEYLTNQSEGIFRELYDCSWYNYAVSFQKDINFILLRARKPVNIKVGKFNTVTLVYLTSIIKTSFSYLTLVRSVR